MRFPLEFYSYNNIPTERDIFIISKKDYRDFITFWRFYLDDESKFTTHPNWVIKTIRASVTKVMTSYLVVDLFLDTSFRFHSAVLTLPKKDYFYCLENYNYQKQPILVVSDDWFNNALFSNYSSFCMVDAIGVKKTILEKGSISKSDISKFTKEINILSRRYRDYTFFTFGDSVVIKGSFKGDRLYFFKFKPEELVEIASKVRSIFKNVYGFDSYGVFTQGLLFDYDKKGIQKSLLGNHYSLGSLGTPFAEIFEIDETARSNIKSKTHEPGEFYMTDYFYHTLNIEYEEKNHFEKFSYKSKMSFVGVNNYYVIFEEKLKQILRNQSVSEKARILRFRLGFNLKDKLRFMIHRFKVFFYYSASDREQIKKMITKGPTNEIHD